MPLNPRAVVETTGRHPAAVIAIGTVLLVGTAALAFIQGAGTPPADEVRRGAELFSETIRQQQPTTTWLAGPAGQRPTW